MAGEYWTVVQRGHAAALEAVFGTTHPPSAGGLLRAPALRETLAAIATRGADDFYHGDIATRLLAGAARDGAALSGRDLKAVSAEVRHVGGRSRGDLEIYVTPTPSQAPIVLDLLSAVDTAAPPTSTAFAEAVAAVTENRLIERCTVGLPGTAVSVAADEGGAVAVVVHSLSGTQFGSGWVPEDTGVAFSNRVGTALSHRPDLPGAHPRPGAPLPHTLSAAHVRTADGRAFTMATPGGDRQIQWLAQALQGVGLGLHATELVGMPRWFVCPEGDRFGVPGGIGSPWYAFAEPGIEWQGATRCAGYEVRPVCSIGGSLHVVERSDGTRHIASDARAGGAVGAMPSRRAPRGEPA
jgi:gamma-glutamyltranspeptidase